MERLKQMILENKLVKANIQGKLSISSGRSGLPLSPNPSLLQVGGLGIQVGGGEVLCSSLPQLCTTLCVLVVGGA